MSEGAAKKEEKPRKFQAIRGTRDLLPPETALWNHVEQTAQEVFTSYGFGEIRLPIFEQTELFARAVGGETDIVSKEMYTFVERSEKLERNPKIRALGSFLEKVRQLYDTAEIPETDRNDLYLGRAEDAWDKVVGVLNGGSQSATFYDDLDQLILCIDAMQLGIELSLRPEATASVCRAYIEHGMQQLPQPVKLYYMGPMFRRERPQKGRYRQFYQIGAEVLGGSDAPAIDAEVIEMVMEFFGRVELQGVQLDINSIGDRNCRPKYVELLRAELVKVKDKLGPDSQRRIETNPLRVLDSKVKEEQSIIENLPRIGDHLCKDCALHYADLKHELELREVKYGENWRLVRGLDYYTRTTFEITAKGLGSQNAVCGGGRYDGLVELLGGPPTKGIGFAIGEDRLILSLQESGQRRSP
jgi:histidyl-tRNA synthetase